MRILTVALCLLVAWPAMAAEKVSIAIAGSSFVYLPVHVAKSLGLFAEEGLEPEFIESGSGAKSLAAMVAGSVDFLTGSPTSMLRAREKGAPALIVGATMTQFGSQVVAAGPWAKQHGITSASSYADKLRLMKGARGGISSAGSASDIQLRFLASEAKLNPERDMTIQSMVQPVMLATLEQGRLDLVTMSPPYAEMAVQQFGAVLAFNTSKGEIPALDGIFYLGVIVEDDYAKKKSDTVIRFLRVMQKALDAMHDPARTLATRDRTHAVHMPKLDKKAFDLAWENNLPAYPRTIMIDKAMVERVGNFMASVEKAPIDPKVIPDSWTDVYAKQALQSLGR
jgi:NitT/TauT family transport system substrate-binding protein